MKKAYISPETMTVRLKTAQFVMVSSTTTVEVKPEEYNEEMIDLSRESSIWDDEE